MGQKKKFFFTCSLSLRFKSAFAATIRRTMSVWQLWQAHVKQVLNGDDCDSIIHFYIWTLSWSFIHTHMTHTHTHSDTHILSDKPPFIKKKKVSFWFSFVLLLFKKKKKKHKCLIVTTHITICFGVQEPTNNLDVALYTSRFQGTPSMLLKIKNSFFWNTLGAMPRGGQMPDEKKLTDLINKYLDC